MTAAATTMATATSPWPAAAGNWTKRRDEDDVLQVWRLIANAGPKGIAKAVLRTHLNDIDDAVLTQHLQELRRKGHARFMGGTASTRHGVWVATPTPWPDEPAPAWIGALPADETDDLAPPPGAADAAVQAARSLPNSVFALGVAAELDIDAVHRSRAEQPAAESPPAPPPAIAHTQAPTIVVALDNLGRLMVHEDGTKPVVLSPDATRALFSYLDRTVMGAIGPVLMDVLP